MKPITMTSQPLTFSDCLLPEWPVASRVRALVTSRAGGVSVEPYGAGVLDGQSGGLNLGLHTGDEAEAVLHNRSRLIAMCGAQPAWLEQIHGSTVVDAQQALLALDRGQSPLKADASVTDAAGVGCIVMVADCMPVLLADAAGRAVGAAHAGWRGLVGGVIEHTAQEVTRRCGGSADLHAFLGPAIGPQAFEVGAEVRAAFLDAAQADERAATEAAFVRHPSTAGKYFGNLYALARLRLARLGIKSVTGGEHCTFSEPEHFYSFRRDRVTGRFAAMIWIASEA